MATVDRESHSTAIDQFRAVANTYIAAFGSDKEGIEQMAEDLCRIVADERYPGQWAGLVQFIMKASG